MPEIKKDELTVGTGQYTEYAGQAAPMDLSQLAAQLANLQKQLDALKNSPAEPGPGEKGHDYAKSEHFQAFKTDLAAAQKNLLDIMKTFADRERVFIATCITATSYNGQGNGTGTSYFNSLDSIDEDSLSASLEPFTNPRRIALLKVLIDRPLTVSEITHDTGLVGGQLYHHLTNLIEAGLINKKGDKYYACGQTQGLIAGLIAAIGGTKIAQRGNKDSDAPVWLQGGSTIVNDD